MLNFDKRKYYVKEIEKATKTDWEQTNHENPYLIIHKHFIKKCNNYIRAIAKEHNWQVITNSHPFCEYSCFIKAYGLYVYIHLSDFRFWRYQNVLYRLAKHSQDYTGLDNHYCDLMDLETSVKILLEKNAKKCSYCGELIETTYYESSDTILCENCGQELLEELDGVYLYQEDAPEHPSVDWYDEVMPNLEIFEKEVQ